MPLTNPLVGSQIRMFNASGELLDSTTKCWVAIVVPTTGNGFTIDISAAGFSSIISVQSQIIKNVSSASTVPIISVQSYSTTEVKLNIVQSNSTVVSLLGTTVNGLLFVTDFTGCEVHLFVLGL